MTVAPATGEAVQTRPAIGPVLAGAAFALAAAHLALIAYLDALTSQNYEWIISGPAPFAGFGGGPFMLWFHVSFALGVVGFALTGIALLTHRRALLSLALVLSLTGLFTGPWQLVGAVL